MDLKTYVSSDNEDMKVVLFSKVFSNQISSSYLVLDFWSAPLLLKQKSFFSAYDVTVVRSGK